jgi:hypothetical protein
MNEGNVNRRIKFSYLLAGWTYKTGNRQLLKDSGARISPSEYRQEMDGHIFCPLCFTNLNRVPKDKDHFSNGRDAHFVHLRKYNDVHCDLRSKKPEGKRYDTYEEARKAIDDENLVIVNDFITEKPEMPEGEAGEYEETAVEDFDGPVSDTPIGRHNGESFQLPSKITTVLGICRNFDSNLNKYYFFPGQQHALLLSDLLHDIRNVTEEDGSPKLYFGIIKDSFNAGKNPKPTNIRMTELFCHGNVKDFYLKDVDQVVQEKGIHDDTKGRIVIMYGKITPNGIGLCIQKIGWGEYALLPEKYNNLLLQV